MDGPASHLPSLTLFAAIAVALGALAYWRWGDPDRSDRIGAMIGPDWLLVATVIFVSGAIIGLQHKDWIGAGIRLFGAIGFAATWHAERRKRAGGSDNQGL